MMRRIFMPLLLTLALLGTTGANAFAESQPGHQEIEGTWYFMILIDGLPPCQCIQIDTFSAEGSMEGPANDKFSSDQRGVWSRTGPGEYAITILQNSIDKDGNAAGLFVIKSPIKLTGIDKAEGKFTFQILSNGGAVVATGTGSLKAVRVRP